MTNEQVATRLTNFIIDFFNSDFSKERTEVLYTVIQFIDEDGPKYFNYEERFEHHFAISAISTVLYKERDLPAPYEFCRSAEMVVFDRRNPGSIHRYCTADEDLIDYIASIIFDAKRVEFDKPIEKVGWDKKVNHYFPREFV